MEPEAVTPQLPGLTFTAPAGEPAAGQAAGNGHSPPSPQEPQQQPFQHGRRVPAQQRTVVPASPPASPQADALKPEPRSKPRRAVPWRLVRRRKGGRTASPALVIIGLAVLALVATLLVAQTRKPGSHSPHVLGTQTQRPSPTAPAGEVSALLGYTLVAADAGSDLAMVQFSGMRWTAPGLSAAGYPEVPVRTGGSVVVVSAGTAYALSPPFTDPPTRIGPADHVFPARTPGGVGVWRAGVGGALPTVGFVAVPGTDATGSATVTIPRDLRPLAELQSGILVWNEQAPRGRLRVWRPAADGSSGTFVRTIGVASAVVGWSDDKVAWLASAGCTSNGECPLHVTDVATGSEAVVPPPPGFAGYLPGGAFSPTASLLFGVFVFNPAQQEPAARLALVSFTAPAAGARPRWTPVLVPQGDVGMTSKSAPLSVVWTPDGTHVLFSGSSGRIHDYRPGRTASSATEQPASASFTVVGAPRVSPSPTGR